MKLTTTEAKELTYIRALVMGDSGIGKTTSLGTLPPQKTLIAAAERGLLPLRGRGYNVVTVETWDDVRALVRLLQTATQAEDGSLTVTQDGASASGITVLAIDSLTVLAQLCIREIVEVDRRALMTERTKGKTDKPENVYEDLMQMEDWNLYRTRMSNLLGLLVHLPVHLVLTSLTAWREDKRTGSVYRIPALNGALALECPAYFDLVLHMESVQTADNTPARVWRTYNDGVVVAKDATGRLDPLVEPDWTKVFKAILSN